MKLMATQTRFFFVAADTDAADELTGLARLNTTDSNADTASAGHDMLSPDDALVEAILDRQAVFGF